MADQTPMMPAARRWPDYAAIWRWHFYAGLFCLPFVCWLAITGAIYLFRPDVEAWLDRPYENLRYEGERAQPSAEAEAALGAVPGSTFSRYQPPATPTGAAQVLVQGNKGTVRVYVHPKTLQPMHTVLDNHRLMAVVSNLHGNLLAGNPGSILVELAASWAVVMIITGLYLWWPRGRAGIAGVLYPRLGRSGRVFWRDLHAVTGMWVSLITLFMLMSGLPWAKSWGTYLNWARSLSPVTAGTPDWPIGSPDTEVPAVAAQDEVPNPANVVADASGPRMSKEMPWMTEEEMAAMSGNMPQQDAVDLVGLDGVMPTVRTLNIPPPVWVMPSAEGSSEWIAASQSQNRPLRVSYRIAASNGAVIDSTGFADQNMVDKTVNVSIAVHEGQLFGRLNQAILVVTAIGLVLLTASCIVLWWRRRPEGVLGAPRAAQEPRFAGWLVGVIVLLAVLLPLFGASLAVVVLLERAVFQRLPRVQQWLGLAGA